MKEKRKPQAPEPLREILIEELQKAWQRICYDMLEMAPDHQMSAEDIRDVVPDSLDKGPRGLLLSLAEEQQKSILKEAFPHDMSI